MASVLAGISGTFLDPFGNEIVGLTISISDVITVSAGSDESATWNHGRNSIRVFATPLEEPHSFWWVEVIDADNIKMHIASADLINDHTFRVMVIS